MDDDQYFDPLPLGTITHLSDEPCDTSRKIPLGFPIPGGDDVTAYRERMKAGVYDAPQPEEKPKRATRRAKAVDPERLKAFKTAPRRRAKSG